MYKHVLVASAAAVALTGCLHGRGEHHIPVTRDYKNLECTTICEAEQAVDKAHRVGGHHFAPYEAASAEHYFEFGVDARAEGDKKGTRDYATLAKKYAEEAIAKGGIEDKGEMPMPDNACEARAEFDRLVARYKELCACKSKVVAPTIYAHIEANLAQAEHELNECHGQTPEIWGHLRLVEPDIDAIWAKDTDGDCVKDMQDGEPWKAEDKDGFQDEDGIPEPKPYPALSDVTFDTDSAKLNAQAKGYLNGVAHMLFNGYKEVTVILSAHTDSDASDEYNQALSQRREDAVKAYLVAAGVTQEMITSGHAGETTPKADNSSEAGKAQNRRVEIKLDSADPVSPFCQH
jgi:outer membrane protein OmpA-like peptidoglycan-associated protein